MKLNVTVFCSVLFHFIINTESHPRKTWNVLSRDVNMNYSYNNSTHSISISDGKLKVRNRNGEEIAVDPLRFQIINGIVTDTKANLSKNRQSSGQKGTQNRKRPSILTRHSLLRKQPKKTDDDEIDSVLLVGPDLDARKAISACNQFMTEIFERMNKAIEMKKLDPMELRVEPNGKMDLNSASSKIRDVLLTNPYPGDTNRPTTTTESFLILEPPTFPTKKPTKKPSKRPKPSFSPIVAEQEEEEEEDKNSLHDFKSVKGSLYGISTLKRTGDVSISLHDGYIVIKCPFSLGPLELEVSKTVGRGKFKRTKSAKATTELMLGLMDLKIDTVSGSAEIMKVIFDELGGVAVEGGVRKRTNDNSEQDDEEARYKLVLASKAAMNLKKVARLVVSQPIKTLKRTS